MRSTQMLPLDQRKNRDALFKPQKVVKEVIHLFLPGKS